MSSGTAPARRVGMWMYRVSDNVINSAGWEFFDASVNWAANLTASTSGTNTWSYPNLQGSIAAQADHTGAKTAGTFVYTPDGVPAAGGLPDTRPGNLDDTWLGAHKRPLEHATGLQPIIEMRARQYHPTLARFLEIDSVQGGCANDYMYVIDPVDSADLSGERCLGFVQRTVSALGYGDLARATRAYYRKEFNRGTTYVIGVAGTNTAMSGWRAIGGILRIASKASLFIGAAATFVDAMCNYPWGPNPRLKCNDGRYHTPSTFVSKEFAFMWTLGLEISKRSEINIRAIVSDLVVLSDP